MPGRRRETRPESMKKEEKTMAKQVDPICGMPVEEEKAAGRSEYRGRNYYFCSAGCREKFNEDPGRYAPQSDREAAEHGGR